MRPSWEKGSCESAESEKRSKRGRLRTLLDHHAAAISVNSWTLCRVTGTDPRKMVVLPAFALPTMRTQNWICGIRGRGCLVSIVLISVGFTACDEARASVW